MRTWRRRALKVVGLVVLSGYFGVVVRLRVMNWGTLLVIGACGVAVPFVGAVVEQAAGAAGPG